MIWQFIHKPTHLLRVYSKLQDIQRLSSTASINTMRLLFISENMHFEAEMHNYIDKFEIVS